MPAVSRIESIVSQYDAAARLTPRIGGPGKRTESTLILAVSSRSVFTKYLGPKLKPKHTGGTILAESKIDYPRSTLKHSERQ